MLVSLGRETIDVCWSCDNENKYSDYELSVRLRLRDAYYYLKLISISKLFLSMILINKLNVSIEH